MHESDQHAEVVMWRTDSLGTRLRLWIRDDRGQIVCSADLGLETEALETYLSEALAARAAAAQPTLW